MLHIECYQGTVGQSKEIPLTSHLLEQLKIQNTDNTKCWQGCGAIETHLLLLNKQQQFVLFYIQECKMVQSFWNIVWWFLVKLRLLLPYDPAVTFLGIYPKELKTYIYTKTCTPAFTAALSIIARTWKQPRGLSTGDWIGRGTCRHRIITRCEKEVSHQARKRHGGILNTYY